MERERRGLGNDVTANLRGKKYDHVTSVSLAIYLVDRGAYRVSGTPRNLDYLAIHRFGTTHSRIPPSPRGPHTQVSSEFGGYYSVH